MVHTPRGWVMIAIGMVAFLGFSSVARGESGLSKSSTRSQGGEGLFGGAIDEPFRRVLERFETNHHGVMEKLQALHGHQQAIGEIVRAYEEKEISVGTARQKLQPVVSAQLEEQATNIDQQIALLEQYLDGLKQMKRNPGVAVQRRIDQLLGKGLPSGRPPAP